MSATDRPERDPQKECARRVKEGGRIIVLPPIGHGEAWSGSAPWTEK